MSSARLNRKIRAAQLWGLQFNPVAEKYPRVPKYLSLEGKQKRSQTLANYIFYMP